MLSYIDAKNFYGWALIQASPYGEKINVIKSLNEIFATADDSEIGCFVDVDLEYTDNIKNTKNSIMSWF